MINKLKRNASSILILSMALCIVMQWGYAAFAAFIALVFVGAMENKRGRGHS